MYRRTHHFFIAILGLMFLITACSDDPSNSGPDPVTINVNHNTADVGPGGETDVESPTDTGTSCAPGLELCGTECVNWDSDPGHCGACNAVCSGGGSCVDRVCQVVEDCRVEGCTGLNYCNASDGKCYSGCDRDSQCASGDHGTASCVNNACVETCNAGARVCGIACVLCPDGAGVDGTTCDQGQCVVASCNQGYELCGGGCAECPSGGDSYGCDGDQCVIDECPAGQRFCDGQCSTCPTEDPNGTFQCDGGQCVLGCDTGFHDCDGVCAPSDSVDTCGDRCESCPAGSNGQAVCTETLECSLECNIGFESCGGQCVTCPEGADILTTGCDGNRCVATSCGPTYWTCNSICCTYPNNERRVVSDSYRFAKGIVIDHERRPHLVVSGSSLEVHSWNGREWDSQILENSTLAHHASIAIDGAGKLFVAYRNDNQSSLVMAERTASGWAHTTLDQVGDVGAFTSIQLDAQGEPRIAYYDASNRNLKFAERNAGIWTVATVDSSADDVGSRASLVLEADGTPHILYHDVTNNRLMHTSRGAGGWSRRQVATGGDYSIDATIDGSDNVHVAFINGALNQMYANWDGTVWSTATVDSAVSVRWTSIAIGTDGRPQIAYSRGTVTSTTRGTMRHARFTGTQWNVNANLTEGERSLALAIDSEGVRHIVYGLGWNDSSSFRGSYYYNF